VFNVDHWICNIYKDGFIKSLANINDGSVLIDKNDILLRFIIDYKYKMDDDSFKKIYTNLKINYEKNFTCESNINNISNIDEILLLELLKNVDYN